MEAAAAKILRPKRRPLNTPLTKGWQEFYAALNSGEFLPRPVTQNMGNAGKYEKTFANETFIYALRGMGIDGAGAAYNAFWDLKIKIGNSFNFIDDPTCAANLFGNESQEQYELPEPVRFGVNEITQITISDIIGNGITRVDLTFLTIAPTIGF